MLPDLPTLDMSHEVEIDPQEQISRVQALIGYAVLVRLHAPPEKTDSGLWIPDCAEQNKGGYEGALANRLRLGTVIAAGPGNRDSQDRLHPCEVSPGDEISFYYFAEYEWLIWPCDGYALLPERFIQAIIRKGDPKPVTPLHDRIVIKRVGEAESVRGGILIPDSAKEKPQEGEVIAVGTGKRSDSGAILPLTVKPGDHVLFGKHSGTEVRFDGRDLLIMREEELLAVLAAPK